MRETVRLDHTNLCPEIPTDYRFNSSIVQSGDGYLIAFRHSWKNSRIYAARLDRDFKRNGIWRKLDLPVQVPSLAQEDPRWFRLCGRLYLSYIWFSGINATGIMYAEINEETLEVKNVIWPQWAGANRKEKNWQAFDYNGELHFVYSINPHVVLKVPVQNTSNDPHLEWVCNTPFKGNWAGGLMRGGASPVLHNGEYYSFFHGSVDREPPNRRRQYCTGLYCFESKPPFAITRYTPEPLSWADPLVSPNGLEVDVEFVAGAVFRDGQWVVSYGMCDTWTEIRFYDESEIEDRLNAH